MNYRSFLSGERDAFLSGERSFLAGEREDFLAGEREDFFSGDLERLILACDGEFAIRQSTRDEPTEHNTKKHSGTMKEQVGALQFDAVSAECVGLA